MSLDSIPNWIMAASGVFVAYVTWLSYSVKHRSSPPKPERKSKPFIPEIKPESKSEQSRQGMSDGVGQKDVQKRGFWNRIGAVIVAASNGATLGLIVGAILGAIGGSQMVTNGGTTIAEAIQGTISVAIVGKK